MDITGHFLVQLFLKDTVLPGPLACVGQLIMTLQAFIDLFFCFALQLYLTVMKVNKGLSSLIKEHPKPPKPL